MEKTLSNDIWLAHHGIKGQRWGVRRFQNPDGSLTSAGKKRYNSMVEDSKKYGEAIANLERYGLREKMKPGQQILVPTEIKQAYKNGVDYLQSIEDKMRKNYKDVFATIKTMDDGYDYVATYLQDEYIGTLEYYTLIGKSSK